MHFEFVSVELFNVEKYPKSRKVLKIFETDSTAKGIGKIEKVMEKVMKSHEIWRGQRIKYELCSFIHSFIYLFRLPLMFIKMMTWTFVSM